MLCRVSSVGIATGYELGKVRGLIPGGWGRFSAPVQTSPGAHPASYKMDTGSFRGGKRPGRGVDHPLYLAPRLKKEELYLYSPSETSWPVLS